MVEKIQPYEDSLVHYGVKGMKWGVRRSEAELARARGSTTKKKSFLSRPTVKKTSPKKASKTKEKPKESLSDLSDEELSRRVRRLQMERQYRDLSPKTVSLGKSITDTLMNRVIVPAATEAGKQLLRDYLLQQGNSVLNIKQPQQSQKNKDNKE